MPVEFQREIGFKSGKYLPGRCLSARIMRSLASNSSAPRLTWTSRGSSGCAPCPLLASKVRSNCSHLVRGTAIQKGGFTMPQKYLIDQQEQDERRWSARLSCLGAQGRGQRAANQILPVCTFQSLGQPRTRRRCLPATRRCARRQFPHDPFVAPARVSHSCLAAILRPVFLRMPVENSTSCERQSVPMISAMVATLARTSAREPPCTMANRLYGHSGSRRGRW